MMMCTLLLHESAQSTAQRDNALENSFLSFVVIFPSFQLFYSSVLETTKREASKQKEDFT